MTQLNSSAANRANLAKAMLFWITLPAIAAFLVLEIRAAHWSWRFMVLFFMTLLALQIVLNRMLPWIDRVFFRRGN